MISPCLNCPIRHAGCHANCEDYKDFKAERQKEVDYGERVYQNYKSERMTKERKGHI